MNEIFLLYLWTRLDALQSVLVIALVVSVISLAACLVAWQYNCEYENDRAEAWWKTSKKVVPWIICIAITLVIIPSKTDAAIVAGGWLVKEASQSEIAKNIGERTYKLIVGRLDEELAKLEGGKK